MHFQSARGANQRETSNRTRRHCVDAAFRENQRTPTRVSSGPDFTAASATQMAKFPLHREPLHRKRFPCQTSYQAVFGQLALVLPCPFQLFQLPSGSDRESAPETREGAVVFSCLFRLSPARRREPGYAIEGREQRGGCSPVLFPFLPMLFPFPPRLFLVHPMLARANPAPFSVEQVVLQWSNPASGRSKSSPKR
jgi:hypothetical protein